MQGHNDGADGLLGADDEDFYGLSVRLGIAVKLESKFKVNLPTGDSTLLRKASNPNRRVDHARTSDSPP